MSLKFQKIIRWIPHVNLLVFLQCLVIFIKDRRSEIPIKPFVKFLARIAVLVALSSIFNHGGTIKESIPLLGFIYTYLQLYTVSSFGIEVQEAMENEKH